MKTNKNELKNTPQPIPIHIVLSKCLKNGIKVYPEFDKQKKGWYIEVNVNVVKKRYNKKLKSKEIDTALNKTWRFYFDKL